MLEEIIAIFIGGGLGAVLRYLLTKCSHKFCGFPHVGTFVANTLGCLLIGYIFAITMDKVKIPDSAKLFITVGFLGGLTTFSTFNNETFCLIREGKLTLGIGYMVVSCTFGLFFTLLGYHLGKY